MSITNRERKILWAKSGNRCAFCREKLVINKTQLDKDSVVGEECHIIAKSPQDGKRYDPEFSQEKINQLDNFILLCATHHKLVDDQPETFTVKILKELREKHEIWVENKFNDKEELSSPKVKRIRKNIPKYLPRITSGKKLLSMVGRTHCTYKYNDENLSSDEIEIVGGFFQYIYDCNMIYDDLEPIDYLRTEKDISDQIEELKENGFYVFSYIEKQKLEGGCDGATNWNALHLSISKEVVNIK